MREGFSCAKFFQQKQKDLFSSSPKVKGCQGMSVLAQKLRSCGVVLPFRDAKVHNAMVPPF